MAATSDTATLIIPEVAAIDQGQYHCQVSNKDGAVNSAKAALRVDKASRLAGHVSHTGRLPRLLVLLCS